MRVFLSLKGSVGLSFLMMFLCIVSCGDLKIDSTKTESTSKTDDSSTEMEYTEEELNDAEDLEQQVLDSIADEETITFKTSIKGFGSFSLVGQKNKQDGISLVQSASTISPDNFRVYAVYSDLPDIEGSFTYEALTGVGHLELAGLPRNKAFGVIVTDENGSIIITLVFDNTGKAQELTDQLNYYLTEGEAYEIQAQIDALVQPLFFPNDSNDQVDAEDTNNLDLIFDANDGVSSDTNSQDSMVYEVEMNATEVHDGVSIATPNEVDRNEEVGEAYLEGSLISDELSYVWDTLVDEGMQLVILSECDELQDTCTTNSVTDATDADETLADMTEALRSALEEQLQTRLVSDSDGGSEVRSTSFALNPNNEETESGSEEEESSSDDTSTSSSSYASASFSARFYSGVNPRTCARGGYNVSDYTYNEFYNFNEGDTYIYQGPQIYIEEETDGTITMVLVSENDDGTQKIDRYEITKTGYDDSFNLSGSKRLTEDEIKTEAAGDYLREILDKQNVGVIRPDMPTWTDFTCDPVRLAGEILNSVGHDRHEGDDFPSIFSDFAWEESNEADSNDMLAFCGEEEDENALMNAENFCYTDGVLKTDFTSDLTLTDDESLEAAQAFCQAVDDGESYSYWNVELPGAVTYCEYWEWDYNTWNGSYYTVEGITEEECWNSPYWGWMSGDYHSMYEDCSTLRVAGVELKSCQWQKDWNNTDDTHVVDWDTEPWHLDLWSKPLSEIDDTLDAYELEQSISDSYVNPLETLQEQIEGCMDDFSRQEEDSMNRRIYIEVLQSALKAIKSKVDKTTGETKYVTTEEGLSISNVDYGKMELTNLESLEDNLALAHSRIDSWQESIAIIVSFYDMLNDAANQAHHEEEACLVADLNADNFKTSVANFKVAYDDLETYRNKAYNHISCIEMDDYIFKIRELVTYAPMTGLEDILVDEDLGEVFLVEDECTGFYDWQGECVNTVECDAPNAEDRYIIMEDLLSEATIASGCENITERIGLYGQRHSLPDIKYGVPIKSGDVTVRAYLMTSHDDGFSALKSCYVSLKIPRLNKDGCWEYEHEDDSSLLWTKLTDEEKSAADRAKYTLSYDTQKVNMDEISNRKKYLILLKAISDLESAAKLSDEEWEAFIETNGE